MHFPLAGTPQICQVECLPPFVSPDQLDPQLQTFLEEATSRLCNWLGSATQRGPLPALSVLPEVAPSFEGRSAENLLEDLQLVMDGSYHPSHPGALAHLDPPPLTASIAADLICAGLNNNLLAEELSPSLSRLEREICRWFSERIGLPKESGGVAASGGSLSNLMALVVARKQAGKEFDQTGVVLASEDAHVSIAKALNVMGLSGDSLYKLPTNQEGKVSIEALKDQLETFRSVGKKCFALVATAGTTVRGAIDPLAALGELCTREEIWFHVDGAIGGVFAIPQKTAPLLEGISKANSVTVNPQKVLGITKTSSLLLVADRTHLVSTFSTGLPYMEPAWGDAHGGELGLQGTRSAEVLKLWLGLRQLGDKGILDLLEGAIERRCYFQNKLDTSRFDLISGPLHLIAFTPKCLDEHESAEWSLLARKTLLDKQFMLSRCRYKGRHYLKAVLGNPHTQTMHLDKLENLLNKTLKN